MDLETEVSGMEQLAGSHTKRKRHIQDLGLGRGVPESVLLSPCNNIDTHRKVTDTDGGYHVLNIFCVAYTFHALYVM